MNNPAKNLWVIWPDDGGSPVVWFEPCAFPVDDGEIVQYTETSRLNSIKHKEYVRGYSDAETEINKTALGEKVDFLSKQNAEQQVLIEKLKSTLSEIARPKVGPDIDWTQKEVDKWRAIWYNKYESMAREALKDV
jgi:hypothetical protein